MGAFLSLFDARSQAPSTADPREQHAAVLGGRLFRSRASGLLIHFRSWLPAGGAAAARAHVYLAHGWADHCGRYEPLAAALAAAGLAVHALDHGGHGMSEGERGYTEKFDHWVGDLLQLAREVRPTSGRRFLLGHSTGGAVALLALAQAASEGAGAGFFAGCVLSAPLIEADKDIDTPLNRFLARTLSNLAPKLVAAPGVDPRKQLSDPALQAWARRDPLNYRGGLRVRTGFECMGAIARVRAFAQARGGALATTPLLMLHGERDRLVYPSGTKWLHEQVTGNGNGDATLRVVDGAAHEVFFERDGERVCGEIAQWIAARC